MESFKTVSIKNYSFAFPEQFTVNYLFQYADAKEHMEIS